MRPASDKAVAALASLRERERPRNGPLPKKPAAGARASLAHPKLNDSARPADARAAGLKVAADKRPVALERRVPVMPEDRQSQLKLLIARGKEQGYLTYAQVNDHLPSEIVDPEQIEDIVNTINDMAFRCTRRHRTPRRCSRASHPRPPTRKPSRKPRPRSPRSMPSSAAPPIRCACTCARWGPWSC